MIIELLSYPMLWAQVIWSFFYAWPVQIAKKSSYRLAKTEVRKWYPLSLMPGQNSYAEAISINRWAAILTISKDDRLNIFSSGLRIH